MNDSFNQKKMSDIEEALKLKDEGKRLPYIVKKFPNRESEIREVFGTVLFLKENAEKIAAPINIFKTLLSKMPGDSPIQLETCLKKEIERANNNAYVPETRYYENAKNGGLPMSESSESENDKMFGKWKIIASVIILAIIMGFIFLRSDSKMKIDSINENIKPPQNSDELSSVSNTNDVSSSANNEARR